MAPKLRLVCGATAEGENPQNTFKFQKAQLAPHHFCLPERQHFEDPAILMRDMQRDGMTLSQRVLGRVPDPTDVNQVRL